MSDSRGNIDPGQRNRAALKRRPSFHRQYEAGSVGDDQLHVGIVFGDPQCVGGRSDLVEHDRRADIGVIRAFAGERAGPGETGLFQVAQGQRGVAR